MRFLTLFLLISVECGIATVASVLFFSTGWSNSHTMFAQRFASALASDEQHNVSANRYKLQPFLLPIRAEPFTVWTCLDAGVSIRRAAPNVRQIVSHYSLGAEEHFKKMTFASAIMDGVEKAGEVHRFLRGLTSACMHQLNDSDGHFEQLRAAGITFDLAVVSVFDYCGFVIGRKLGVEKFLFFSGAVYIFEQVYVHTGLPMIPSYIPVYDATTFDPRVFRERMTNARHHLQYIHFALHIAGNYLDHLRKYFRQVFADDLFTFVENTSVGLMLNGDQVLALPRPLAPDTFYLGDVSGGGQPEEELDEHFKQLMNKERTVVVSFGTITQANSAPAYWTESLYHGFGKLTNCTVIWHQDTALLNNTLYPHIHIFTWLPLRALLAHRNARVFVSHAGYNSLIESTQAGVPMVLIPLRADQPENAKQVVRLGVGEEMSKTTLSIDIVYRTVSMVLNNESYHIRAKSLTSMLSDRLILPEKALVHRMRILAKHSVSVLPRLYRARKFHLLQLYCVDLVIVWSALILCAMFFVFRNFSRCAHGTDNSWQ